MDRGHILGGTNLHESPLTFFLALSSLYLHVAHLLLAHFKLLKAQVGGVNTSNYLQGLQQNG